MAEYCRVKTRFTAAAAFVWILGIVVMIMISGCSSDQTFDISGTVTSGGSALAGVTITVSGNASMTVTTDSTGAYVLSSLSNGQYTVTPSLKGYVFSPTSQSITVNGMGTNKLNFTATSVGMVATTEHTVFMTHLNQVNIWGSNSSGQLGVDPTVTAQRSTSALLATITSVVAVAAGDKHTVALKSDATVWAWGSNGNGQLGNGTIVDSFAPVQVRVDATPTYLTSVAAISAGDAHTVALKSDGTVWAWGSNSNGQLGNGTKGSDSLFPVQVMVDATPTYLTGVTAVSAGHEYTVALKSDGTVWAWGNNWSGQLGDGTITDNLYAEQVMVDATPTYLTGVTAISAGHDHNTGLGMAHTVALKSDGTVWTWGENSSGELGDGTLNDSCYPVQVKASAAAGDFLTSVTVIAAGDDHTAVLKSDGTVWAWGSNSNGQLGNNSTVQSSYPVQSIGLANIMHIAAGYRNTVARQRNATIWAWGNNSKGQLGDGTTTDRWSPVTVAQP